MRLVGIYKITSPSGKVYIGQSWNIDIRFNAYRNARCKSQQKLYNSLLKYGHESHKFEIIDQLSESVSQDIMNEKEQYYIDYYRNQNIILLNIKEAGNRGKYLQPRKRHTEDWKKACSEWLKKRKPSEKMMNRMIGNQLKKGIPVSSELKYKLSVLHTNNNYAKGIKHTEEQRNKKSVLMKSSLWALPKKQILCLNNGVLYQSQREASISLGICYKHIPDVCKGRRNHVGGYKFQYA